MPLVHGTRARVGFHKGATRTVAQPDQRKWRRTSDHQFHEHLGRDTRVLDLGLELFAVIYLDRLKLFGTAS